MSAAGASSVFNHMNGQLQQCRKHLDEANTIINNQSTTIVEMQRTIIRLTSELNSSQCHSNVQQMPASPPPLMIVTSAATETTSTTATPSPTCDDEELTEDMSQSAADEVIEAADPESEVCSESPDVKPPAPPSEVESKPSTIVRRRRYSISEKLYAISMLDNGHRVKEVAHMMGIEDDTVVARWRQTRSTIMFNKPERRGPAVKSTALEAHLISFMETQAGKGMSVGHEDINSEVERMRVELGVAPSLRNNNAFAQRFFDRQARKMSALPPTAELPASFEPPLTASPARGRTPVSGKRMYSAETKLSAVRLLEEGGRTVMEVCKTLGIYLRSDVTGWRASKKRLEAKVKLDKERHSKKMERSSVPPELDAHLYEFVVGALKTGEEHLTNNMIEQEIENVAHKWPLPPSMSRGVFVDRFLHFYKLRLDDPPKQLYRGHLPIPEKLRAAKLFASGASIKEIRRTLNRYVQEQSVRGWVSRIGEWSQGDGVEPTEDSVDMEE